jgi:phosphoglycolate phosphatase
MIVGFDLDMTLIDSRAGIAATYRALTARTGVHVDADAAVARLGPPLRDELARWFPASQVDGAVETYRALYPAHAYRGSRPMPGAAQAVAAVRRHGGRVVVVTSKLGRFAEAHLNHVGIVVDEVLGDRFGPGKEKALISHGVGIYVGDHVADVRAAVAAGARGVGVATGPCSRDELARAGADVVLADLHGFPDWLDGGEIAATHADGSHGPG